MVISNDHETWLIERRDQLAQRMNTLAEEEPKTILMPQQLIDKNLGVDADGKEMRAPKAAAKLQKLLPDF